jgi:restriction endonuclease S subunit
MDLKGFKLIQLFDIDKGRSKYTKKFGNENKGDYPVYSASNNAPLTHINTFDFNGEYLTWATNGFAGYIKIISGKFSINGDRGILIPKKVVSKQINLMYVKYILEPILRDLAKGRKGEMGDDEFTKVYPSMIENIEINLPVDKKGKIDIVKQNQISKKIDVINSIKKELGGRLDNILDATIDFVN